MMNASSLPQINGELKPTDRVKASWLVPIVVAGCQAVVMIIVGFSNYFALGSSKLGTKNNNCFTIYANEYSDWMAISLQIGCAMMTYLSIPISLVPAKAQ